MRMVEMLKLELLNLSSTKQNRLLVFVKMLYFKISNLSTKIRIKTLI